MTRPSAMKEPRTIIGWYTQPINSMALAIGTVRGYRMGKGTRFHVRRIVWGRLLAREEKRDGETIKPVTIFVREQPRLTRTR